MRTLFEQQMDMDQPDLFIPNENKRYVITNWIVSNKGFNTKAYKVRVEGREDRTFYLYYSWQRQLDSNNSIRHIRHIINLSEIVEIYGTKTPKNVWVTTLIEDADENIPFRDLLYQHIQTEVNFIYIPDDLIDDIAKDYPLSESNDDMEQPDMFINENRQFIITQWIFLKAKEDELEYQVRIKNRENVNYFLTYGKYIVNYFTDYDGFVENYMQRLSLSKEIGVRHYTTIWDELNKRTKGLEDELPVRRFLELTKVKNEDLIYIPDDLVDHIVEKSESL